MLSIITKLLSNESLSTAEAALLCQQLLISDNDCQIAAALSLLKTKGETIEEIFGFVSEMRKQMQELKTGFDVIDIVGTGGDGANTINISTASAIVAASCGVKVVKHGNRAVSSKCGAADLLEYLGFNLNASATSLITMLQDLNFAFCFAPNFHPSLKKLRCVRRKLQFPTIFNLLGPLLNPAAAPYLLLGVADAQKILILSEVLLKLKVKTAFVFNGDGVDEITTCTNTTGYLVTANKIEKHTLIPEELGFKRGQLQDLQGGAANINAEVIINALLGKQGTVLDTITLNAAMALFVTATAASIKEAIVIVKKNIAAGKAQQKLSDIIALSHQKELLHA